MSRRTGLLFALFVFSTAMGCSGSGEGPKGTVSGKVTLDGRPIGNIGVSFDNEAGIAPVANVAADGTFEVKNYKGAGLPVGKYKIAVSSRMIMSDDEIPLVGKKTTPVPPPPKGIPDRYFRISTSGLSVEVKEGKNEPLHIELKK